MSQQNLDPETMSLDELRQLAMNPPAEEKPVEQPKENGEEATPTVFRREIDLGDGSGKQVFEGATMDELVDKLANAQLHATKKIRELSREQKVETAAAKETDERELTPDEEWLLSQEFLNHPSKTQKKIIEGLLGMSIADFKAKAARISEYDAEKQAASATDEFLAANPDFHRSPKNGSRMQAYLKNFGLEPTLENMNTAYRELSESGLLEAKPEEAQQEEVRAESEAAETQEPTRIAKPATTPATQPQRRIGSGLTSRGRAAARVATTQPTEDELYAMPLEKLEELARQQR